jgi:hypothetical protein
MLRSLETEKKAKLQKEKATRWNSDRILRPREAKCWSEHSERIKYEKDDESTQGLVVSKSQYLHKNSQEISKASALTVSSSTTVSEIDDARIENPREEIQ